jgi:membrane protein YqaA with SNARE-associated domain
VSEWLSYGGLFVSSFLSATLLPGGSEAVLAGLLLTHQGAVVPLVILASLGNTLGGLTNIVIGRLLPQQSQQGRWQGTATAWLHRFGPAALLFSWLPVIGDLLCVVAGWLRLSWFPVLIFLALGKTLRYCLVAAATLKGMEWWH